MAFRNDGGKFSQDQILQMLAAKQGSMSEDELARQEAIPQQAIDMASGVMGTIKAPAMKFGKISQLLGKTAEAAPQEMAVAEQPAMSFIDKYKQAVANSPVKQMTGDVKSTLRNVSFRPEAEQQIGKVIQDVPQLAEEITPIMSEENRLRLLQMIRRDKGLLGK